MTAVQDASPSRRAAISKYYAERCAAVDSRLADVAARERLVFFLRIGLAGTVVVVGALALAGTFSWWWLVLPFAAFVLCAAKHERLRKDDLVARRMRQVFERQQARRARDWAKVPVPETPAGAADDSVARDLDLFGPRSVFHWLCNAHTPMGRERLADWLLHPAPPDLVAHRQTVVRQLAAEPRWNESLQLQGSLLELADTGANRFVQWATGPTWLAARPGLNTLAWAITLSSLAIGGAWLVGGLDPNRALMFEAVPVAAGIFLSFLYLGQVHDIFDMVSGRADEVGLYLDMLSVAERLPTGIGAVSPNERDPRQVAAEACRCLRQLRGITVAANWRRDGLVGLVVLVAQWTLMWEFHLLLLLESWQRRHGAGAAEWFTLLGDLEALAALATAAHDEPDWTFAEVDPAVDTVMARELAHPLLTAEQRVANDVTVGPPGSFLLVSGSNMSGKSTLLRAIGVNVLLGQAGGVVAARQLRLPPVDVATSMRVSDSLADGVSFFFAELLRLKLIVDRARGDQGSTRRLLFLLDEVLQGTNSRERQIAVARVIGHLIACGAIGAVSTHDLELAHREPLSQACQSVHFRETIDRDGARQTMSFDYTLRPGLAPTTNALVLLDLVGLTNVDGHPPL